MLRRYRSQDILKIFDHRLHNFQLFVTRKLVPVLRLQECGKVGLKDNLRHDVDGQVAIPYEFAYTFDEAQLHQAEQMNSFGALRLRFLRRFMALRLP